MCTLSFFPSKDQSGFIVTSNRDESVGRKTIPPRTYTENGVELCFPKDKTAGGTWIGSSSKKRLSCLMNGGFKAHQRSEKYRMSRGLVVKNLLLADDGKTFLKDFNLREIEPFTLINIEWQGKLELLKMVWDGKEKHFEKLPVEPHIWLASMLYSEKTRQERERVFEKFLTGKTLEINENTRKQLLDLHHKFIIDRGNLKTTSITQVVQCYGESEMFYLDLLDLNSVGSIPKINSKHKVN